LSGVIGNPLSGWILQHFDGRHGLAGWQWMFALEALPALVAAIAILLFLKNSVAEASWLTPEERRLVADDLATDRHAGGSPPGSLRELIHDRRIYLCAVIYFAIVLSQYGVTFWVPTLLHNAGVINTMHLGLLSALPFLAAVIAMNIVGRSADHFGERRWHTIGPMLVCIVGLLAFALVRGVPATVVALCFASAGAITASATFWSLPTAFLSGRAAVGGLAIINSIGNLGGFVCPLFIGFIRDRTHSNSAAMCALAAAIFLGVIGVQRIPSNLVDR
jgi:nitrate/nitrite transporter NarK